MSYRCLNKLCKIKRAGILNVTAQQNKKIMALYLMKMNYVNNSRSIYLSLFVTTKLEVLAAPEGKLMLAFALSALQPQQNFLCSFGLIRKKKTGSPPETLGQYCRVFTNFRWKS